MPKLSCPDGLDATSDSHRPASPRPRKKPRLDVPSNPDVATSSQNTQNSTTGRFARGRQQQRASRRQRSQNSQEAGDSTTASTTARATIAQDAIQEPCSSQSKSGDTGASSKAIGHALKRQRPSGPGDEEEGRQRANKKARVDPLPKGHHDAPKPRRTRINHGYKGLPPWAIRLSPDSLQAIREERRKEKQRAREAQDEYIKYRLSKIHNRLPSPGGGDDDDNGGGGGGGNKVVDDNVGFLGFGEDKDDEDGDGDGDMDEDMAMRIAIGNADKNGVSPGDLGLNGDDVPRLIEVFGEDFAQRWLARKHAGEEALRTARSAPVNRDEVEVFGDEEDEENKEEEDNSDEALGTARSVPSDRRVSALLYWSDEEEEEEGVDEDGNNNNNNNNNDHGSRQTVQIPSPKSIDSVRTTKTTTRLRVTRKGRREAEKQKIPQKKEKPPQKKKDTRKRKEMRNKINKTDPDTPSARRLTRLGRSTSTKAVFYELDQRGNARAV